MRRSKTWKTNWLNDGQRWALGIDVTINTLPSEIKTPIPCDQDKVHSSGDDHFPEPAFYSYTFPEPPGLKEVAVRTTSAFYHPQMGEFLLLYENVRSADVPEQVLMEFFQSTYEAGAILGQWDREALEQRYRLCIRVAGREQSGQAAKRTQIVTQPERTWT